MFLRPSGRNLTCLFGPRRFQPASGPKASRNVATNSLCCAAATQPGQPLRQCIARQPHCTQSERNIREAALGNLLQTRHGLRINIPIRAIIMPADNADKTLLAAGFGD
jgi:hypothetical protein